MATKAKQNVTNVTTFKQIEGTPFMVVKNNGKHMICAGQAVVSEKTFNKFSEAKAYVESKPWELIINMACYAMSVSKKLQNAESNDTRAEETHA